MTQTSRQILAGIYRRAQYDIAAKAIEYGLKAARPATLLPDQWRELADKTAKLAAWYGERAQELEANGRKPNV